MNPALRVVISLPLTELFNESGSTMHRRVRELGAKEILELIKAGPVQFVFVDVGFRPQWIPLELCYDCFKNQVRPHLANASERVLLDNFPGGFCYFASQWIAGDDATIVVLERHH